MPTEKAQLEQHLGFQLKSYQLPNWAKFRGDHDSRSCLCDEEGQIIGLIIRNINFFLLSLPSLNKLEYCCISENEQLQSIEFQGEFPSLKYLDISKNQLTELVLPNGLNQLEKLYANQNKLTTIVNLKDLPKLQLLDLSKNQLSQLSLFVLPDLELLYLYDNQLVKFDLEPLPKLQILDLEKNALEHLPATITTLNKLETLYLHENPLKNIPDTVLGNKERHNSWEEVLTYLRSMEASVTERGEAL